MQTSIRILILLTILSTLNSLKAGAQTTCNFAGPNWNETTTACGLTLNGNLSTIEVLYITADTEILNNNLIDLSTSASLQEVIIQSNINLNFGSNSKLLLPLGSKLTLEDGATMTTSSNSPGTLLEIGGSGVWGNGCTGCNNNTMIGPGDVDENSDPADPLPVEVVFFKGKTQQESIALEWATELEINFDYFEILHSANQKNWEIAGTTKGHGNSKDFHLYQFTHKTPLPGTNYYALKAVDLDASWEMHGIIEVRLDTKLSSVRISPNPVRGQEFRLSNIDSEDGAVHIKIISPGGSTILQKELTDFPHLQQLPDEIISGIYFIVLTQKQTKVYRKLIIL